MPTNIPNTTGSAATRPHKNIFKKLSFKSTLAVLLLSPLVNLAVLELLTGNLTQLPRIALAINLLLVYCLFALFLLFFGRIRTALTLYNVLILLLGLAQYYVSRFRGRSPLSCCSRPFPPKKTEPVSRPRSSSGQIMSGNRRRESR